MRGYAECCVAVVVAGVWRRLCDVLFIAVVVVIVVVVDVFVVSAEFSLLLASVAACSCCI